MLLHVNASSESSDFASCKLRLSVQIGRRLRAKTDGDEVQGFAEDIFRVACDRSPEIDKMIEEHGENWRMDRMAAVDRNVLRAAVAELLGFRATPRAVIINEAIEIARKFSSPESAQFINGVLDSVGKEIEAAGSKP